MLSLDGKKKKQVAEHIPKFTNDVRALAKEDQPANEGRTNISPPAHIESPSVDSLADFIETINNEPPSLEARPPGRKAAKRQASLEAHSAIGEKMAKSLDEMQRASSSGWQRANDLHEDQQRFSCTRQKLGMINDKISIEESIAKAEKALYILDPIAIGSPSDKARRVVEMKNTLVALRAQADGMMKRLVVVFDEDHLNWMVQVFERSV
ncbi:hypothetical protein Droror1_Dr00027197 [Drosera rotundifolia]